MQSTSGSRASTGTMAGAYRRSGRSSGLTPALHAGEKAAVAPDKRTKREGEFGTKVIQQAVRAIHKIGATSRQT